MPEDGKNEIIKEGEEFIFPVADFEVFEERLRAMEHKDRVKVLTEWARSLKPKKEHNVGLSQDIVLDILGKNSKHPVPSFPDSSTSRIVLGEFEINGITYSIIRDTTFDKRNRFVEFIVQREGSSSTVGSFNIYTNEQLPGLARNVHREIDKRIRGYGVGKILLSLCEQSAKQLNLRAIRFYSQLPASVLFFFANGYDIENIGEMTDSRLRAIADNPKEEHKFFTRREWVLRKPASEIADLQFN